ncbi:MAG: hypothetical protein HYW07_15720 [Candidatus Latescibacteria bacterium]|nr:hypothetical protein [Candidatus Latescibacterota bacterium]
MAGNSIWSIREDERGYLWFITRFEGASRYDGSRFQTLDALHGLASDNIYSILADKRGNLWFDTDRGVSKYDGECVRNLGVAEELGSNSVAGIAEDSEGNLLSQEGQPMNSPSRLDHLLRVFAQVRAGEGTDALLLALNVFLLLTAYYLIKPVREALILAGGGAEIKSYAAAGQGLLLLGAVPLYSWLAGRLPRRRLIASVTLFFAVCLGGSTCWPAWRSRWGWSSTCGWGSST